MAVPAGATYQTDEAGKSHSGQTGKDEMSQSATPNDPPSATEQPIAPPAPDGNPDATAGDDISIGEIPVVETVELQAETTQKAIDVYAAVKETYKDSGMENYDDLQDFVDKAPDGKKLEADIKAAGFASVNEWNLIITTASFTYSNIIDDQTDDIQQQIEELKLDTELAQDMKDRLMKSLQAMIPSDNNRTIIETIMKDPAFAEKVKLLEIEEE
jgi:hypothetical protein